jgi:hypothetical protein
MSKDKRVEKTREKVNLSVEVSAKITDGTPTLNIIASILKPDKNNKDFEYCGCVAASDLDGLDPTEHTTQLTTTVLKSIIIFLTDTLDKDGAKEVFAEALLEALVQSGLEDAQKLLAPIKNKKWTNSPWAKYDDDDRYDFKEID